MEFLTDLLANRAQLCPEKTALRDKRSGKFVSFFELNQNAERLAALFLDKNIKHGDTIAVICRNRIEFFETLFACAKIGAILVPLNWRSPAPELLPLIVKCAPKLILYGQEDKEVALEIAGEIDTIGYDENYSSLISQQIPPKYRTNWPFDETWYLLFTSGTTGEPKAVIQTYGMALINSINLGQAIDIKQDDVFLNFLPLFHTAGINLHTLPAIFNGCTSWVTSGFDIEALIDLIKSNQLTCFFGVPAVYLALSQHKEFENLDLSNLRSMGCGGAPMPDYLIETYAKKGVIVCNGMGMTETGPTVFLMDKENARNKIGSVGKPQILCNVRIIDNDGNECQSGKSGDLLFSGPGISPGYWKNETATKFAYIEEENGVRWLKTGDVALKDADGYYYIVGRTKEMFISGGENVYPAEVENILAMHEQILEVAVLGVKDEKWGEIGYAYIIAKDGKMPEIEELMSFCRSRLAPFKVPKQFIQVYDFPRTAAGKVQKHLIRT